MSEMDSELVRKVGFVIRQGRADDLTSEQIARAVIGVIRDQFASSLNSSLQYAAEELDEALK